MKSLSHYSGNHVKELQQLEVTTPKTTFQAYARGHGFFKILLFLNFSFVKKWQKLMSPKNFLLDQNLNN